MYKKALFHYNNEGLHYLKPEVLKTKDCNATSFTLLPGTITVKNTKAKIIPVISLIRLVAKPEKDLYINMHGKNIEDVLLTIVLPTILSTPGFLEIFGLELPGICWAGRMFCGTFVPKKDVPPLINVLRIAQPFPFEELKRQHVVLEAIQWKRK